MPVRRDKDKEVSQHDKQSADGGSGFQFRHANGLAQKLVHRQFETDLFEILATPPSLQGQGSH